MEHPDDLDPLYVRYNGGMLGYFLSGAPARYAAAYYPVLAGRMNAFLEEIGCLPILPPTPPAPDATPRVMQETLFQVALASEAIRDAALMTATAFHGVILRDVDPDAAAKAEQTARGLLQNMGVADEALDAFATAVTPEENGWVSADELHTAGLQFLHAVIAPVATAARTAFVAMPFQPPFDTYFSDFYRPLLRELGLHALRAWGGLARESYQALIGLLIRKSGTVLADLTSANANVLHEVGMAQGMEKPLLLILARDAQLPPSNLLDLAIVAYDRSNPDWQASAIRDSAAVLSLSLLGRSLDS
ncbi:MAG: hypothetical protein AAF184_02425 [Pseudomonadota bacterium]